MMREQIEQMNTLAESILSARALILKMCDDMDASNDILEKESIRQVIIRTESELDSMENDYNALVSTINQEHDGN